MWFFVDETWSPDDYNPKFGVLMGVLVKDEQLNKLSRLLFNTRKKYYGVDHAKNAYFELKGKELLKNSILEAIKPQAPLPKNICIVKEMLSYPSSNNNFYLKLFASIVYSVDNKHPQLLSPKPRDLYVPFKQLIENVSLAASEDWPKCKVSLIFDQRIGAQKDIGIAIHNYVGGMKLPNINIHPYFAISNICPGVQFADVMAFLLSKRIQKNNNVMGLYREMTELQWISSSQQRKKRYGFVRFDEIKEASGIRYVHRHSW